jgi:phosphatidylserine/phosphatidylglycerophosphate/cardiolipin synthase-like enzyme
MEIIQDGDEFFEALWNRIDSAEKCVWILTYHMVNNHIPNETLRRCIKAAERGVSVVIYVDYINYWLNPALAKELVDKGGIVKALNPLDPISRWNGGLRMFSRDLFERYH